MPIQSEFTLLMYSVKKSMYDPNRWRELQKLQVDYTYRNSYFIIYYNIPLTTLINQNNENRSIDILILQTIIIT